MTEHVERFERRLPVTFYPIDRLESYVQRVRLFVMGGKI